MDNYVFVSDQSGNGTERSGGWPSRDEVETRWREVLDGSRSREEVHDWTVPWVEGDLGAGPAEDGMVSGALYTLHGFTMAYLPETPNLIHHGPPGMYVKSMEQIQLDLDRWLHNCAEHDRDPEGYRSRQIALASAAERDRRRPNRA